MSSPAQLIQRLNRGVKRRAAQWTFVDQRPFGDELQLRCFRLGNGLKVLTLVDHSAPIVSYHTWFRVGSRYEQAGKTGLAHLFEHLMFGATKNHEHGEFDRLMEEMGVEANAATWTDWTYYYENAPQKALRRLIELEADRMQNLILRKPQVTSEKEVVANERKQQVEDSVEGAAFEELYSVAFRRHPYRWPTIGLMQDIVGFTVDDCRRFYRTHYTPNNASIVIAGDFSEASALNLIQERYASIRGAKRAPLSTLVEPAQRSERVASMTAPVFTDKLLLGYRAPPFQSPDTAALSLAKEVLFGGRSSRIYRCLCLEHEVAVSVRGSIAPYEQPGLFEMWFSLCEGKTIRSAQRLIDLLLAEFAQSGPTRLELEKAMNQIELSFLHGMETANGKAEQIGFCETVVGNGAAMFDQMQAYRAVTPERLKQVVARYLRPSQRTRIEISQKVA